MKIAHVVLIAFLLLELIGVAEAEEQPDAVGRYAITFSVEGLYFLDTATGALWVKSSRSTWKRVDSPVNLTSEEEESPDQPLLLELPKDGVTMPMVQREKRYIPGSSETISVRLGDITAGQVFVEVIDINGRYLVNRTSVRNNEFLRFELNGATVYLHVDNMVNNLVGDDICEVHVSFKRPKIDHEHDGPSAMEKN